jgi:hypothetical protein
VNDREAILAVVKGLKNAGIDYMLVGGHVAVTYGVPRLTKDADFVVELGQASISELGKRLLPGIVLDSQASFESATGTTFYRLKTRDGSYVIEIFLLSDDPHDKERFARRRPVKVLGEFMDLPTPEDLIVTKLRWAKRAMREKDVGDARFLIATRTATLDWPHIERWADRHGTRELLDKIRASLGPEVP